MQVDRHFVLADLANLESQCNYVNQIQKSNVAHVNYGNFFCFFLALRIRYQNIGCLCFKNLIQFVSFVCNERDLYTNR